MFNELIKKNRSYRRFYQDRPVEKDTLLELVELARLSPSGMNRQALCYLLFNTPEMNEKINGNLVWAAYIKGWISPPEGEKPSAFIVMVKDTSVGPSLPEDTGIAAQSITLGAVEKGLGCCMIGNIKKKELAELLALEDKYEIALVIAIGHPKEEVVIEPMGEDGSVVYWRDEQGVHHVPKREPWDIILN